MRLDAQTGMSGAAFRAPDRIHARHGRQHGGPSSCESLPLSSMSKWLVYKSTSQRHSRYPHVWVGLHVRSPLRRGGVPEVSNKGFHFSALHFGAPQNPSCLSVVPIIAQTSKPRVISRMLQYGRLRQWHRRRSGSRLIHALQTTRSPT